MKPPPCKRCLSRGWVCPSGDWAVECPDCNGQRPMSRSNVASVLGVSYREIWLVDTGRAGGEVSRRVLDAFAERLPSAL